MISYTIIDTDVGELIIAVGDLGVTHIHFADESGNRRIEESWQGRGQASETHLSLLNESEKQVREYISGSRKKFDLPISVTGTAFQKRVWDTLCDIPYGTTWSYKELANRIQSPLAVRAVGSANGRNPVSIIVPCHRVIGASGALSGYGGGIERKRWLLEIESQNI